MPRSKSAVPWSRHRCPGTPAASARRIGSSGRCGFSIPACRLLGADHNQRLAADRRWRRRSPGPGRSFPGKCCGRIQDRQRQDHLSHVNSLSNAWFAARFCTQMAHSERFRTPDPRNRNPMLYPAELRVPVLGRLSDLAEQGQQRTLVAGVSAAVLAEIGGTRPGGSGWSRGRHSRQRYRAGGRGRNCGDS